MKLKGFDDYRDGPVFVTNHIDLYVHIHLKRKAQKRLKTVMLNWKPVPRFSTTKSRLLKYSRAWLVVENRLEHPTIMKIIMPRLYKWGP